MKVLTLTDETGKVLYKTTVDNWRVDQVLDGEQLRISITGWTKEFSAPEGAFVKNYTKRKLPDIEADPARPSTAPSTGDLKRDFCSSEPAQQPARRIGTGIGDGPKVVAEAMRVMRSEAANDPARRADAIAALDRYWPEWRRIDPEILGFRAATVGGLDRYWAYTVAKRKATPAEEAQRTRDEERKSPPWTILGPSYPTFPLKPEHRVSYPTPHKTCTCDIKDLMSTGHVTGCPEKKR